MTVGLRDVRWMDGWMKRAGVDMCVCESVEESSQSLDDDDINTRGGGGYDGVARTGVVVKQSALAWPRHNRPLRSRHSLAHGNVKSVGRGQSSYG